MRTFQFSLKRNYYITITFPNTKLLIGNITQAMVHLDLSRDILIVLFGKKSPEYIDLLHQYHYIYRLTGFTPQPYCPIYLSLIY